MGIPKTKGASSCRCIQVGANKQQLEIPLDVVADIPTKVDSSVSWFSAVLGKMKREKWRGSFDWFTTLENPHGKKPVVGPLFLL